MWMKPQAVSTTRNVKKTLLFVRNLDAERGKGC